MPLKCGIHHYHPVRCVRTRKVQFHDSCGSFSANICEKKLKICKYYAFRYLSQNRPFQELNQEKYKHGHWTINHSCILSIPVKDLFCEIVVLLSFLFFCRQACYLETRTSGAPIAVI